MAMSGAPLRASKKRWSGMIERRRLLDRNGLSLADDIGEAGLIAGPDDILDAAVAAWSAGRRATARAVPVPDPPEIIDGRQVAIWY